MPDEMKTFGVECPHCKRVSQVRYALCDPNAEGEAEVAVDCQYCEQSFAVTIPLKYAEPATAIRGVPR